jgi:hypothetical protein
MVSATKHRSYPGRTKDWGPLQKLRDANLPHTHYNVGLILLQDADHYVYTMALDYFPINMYSPPTSLTVQKNEVIVSPAALQLYISLASSHEPSNLLGDILFFFASKEKCESQMYMPKKACPCLFIKQDTQFTDVQLFSIV